MSAKRLRIATFLVLGHYVLALTVGGILHLHGDHRCAVDRARCASACWDEAGEPPGDHPSKHAGCCALRSAATEGAPLVSLHCEKCPVCHFLAQTPLPGQSVEEVTSTRLAEDWVPVQPVRRAYHVPATHPIRGPPAVA